MKKDHVSLRTILEKKLKDAEFKFYFKESKNISDLCHAVAQARQSRGLSQVELAKNIGTSQSVIARLENGNQGRMPSLVLLNRIAVALNLSLSIGFEKAKKAA